MSATKPRIPLRFIQATCYEANKSVLQLRLSLGKKWLDRYLGEAKATRLFNRHLSY